MSLIDPQVIARGQSVFKLGDSSATIGCFLGDSERFRVYACLHKGHMTTEDFYCFVQGTAQRIKRTINVRGLVVLNREDVETELDIV